MRRVRVLVALVVFLLSALTLGGIASADVAPNSPAPIVVQHFDFTVEFPNDTNTCGFPVHEVIHSQGSFRFFEDPNKRVPFANVLHSNISFSFTANGKTVLVDQNFTQHFSSSEPTFTVHGLSVSIRLAGSGLIVHDAGTFVERFDGTVTLVRGPHPILEAGGASAAVQEICVQLSA
jgi:hypothetical protein